MKDIPFKALKKIFDYLEAQEAKHYEEEPSDNHIYNDVCELGAFLDNYNHGEKKNQKIIVPMSENDIQELQSGEEFDWTFPTENGEEIDVHVRQETDEDL